MASSFVIFPSIVLWIESKKITPFHGVPPELRRKKPAHLFCLLPAAPWARRYGGGTDCAGVPSRYRPVRRLPGLVLSFSTPRVATHGAYHSFAGQAELWSFHAPQGDRLAGLPAWDTCPSDRPHAAYYTPQIPGLQGKKGRLPFCGVFVKQLNRPMVTIIGRFLCYALARQRPGLPCVKGAVSEAD